MGIQSAATVALNAATGPVQCVEDSGIDGEPDRSWSGIRPALQVCNVLRPTTNLGVRRFAFRQGAGIYAHRDSDKARTQRAKHGKSDYLILSMSCPLWPSFVRDLIERSTPPASSRIQRSAFG